MNEEILKRLEEIEARAEKATPGPWIWGDYSVGWSIMYARVLKRGAGRYQICDFATRDDAEFIAACREDKPWLCQVVRELFAQCAVMRGAAEEAIEEIIYWHEDMLSEEERMHPRGSGWARVYDKLKASVQPDAGRDLLDRLRKLEKVAEAARELVADLSSMPSRPRDWSASWTQLERALAALEEETND